ncbi:hypothetical protein P1X15_31350 [Runella sp. MFBS21]|uniref:DUF6580 family putative transport protein n=1 Tax=Runella sp. MFBS21 TaxID=3034018 RepID=UPI0023F7DF58|nr:DUF6580 family putative transport protein [Runella sp. MFBS21]MDF7822152.1 hypothetical protein [Runella sp. MFBS21]
MNSGLSRFTTVAMLILLAAVSRVAPHPFNFTPIGAMALFGSAYFNRKSLAFMIPMLAMLLSDAIIGNPSLPSYVSFALITVLGFVLLKKVTPTRIVTASLLASTLFFLVTNFFVWYNGTFYSQNWQGLIACYVAGLAFYQSTFFGNLFFNTIMGDLFYCGILFGSFYFIQRFAFKPSVA